MNRRGVEGAVYIRNYVQRLRQMTEIYPVDVLDYIVISIIMSTEPLAKLPLVVGSQEPLSVEP